MAGGSLPSTETDSQKDSREARSPNLWLDRVAQRSSTHSSALDNAFRFIDGMTKGTVALPFRFDHADDEQQVPPLRSPEFPVELDGVDAPHAPFSYGKPHTWTCPVQRGRK